MSADLTCPTCLGSGEHRCSRRRCRERGNDCPTCNRSGRRLPELAEWDALKAERDQAKEAVRNLDKALRNAVKERGDALDERDRLREPIDLTAVYETIDCDWPVPRCLGVAGWLRWHDEHGWLSVCGRHARAALDPDPDPAERTQEQP